MIVMGMEFSILPEMFRNLSFDRHPMEYGKLVRWFEWTSKLSKFIILAARDSGMLFMYENLEEVRKRRTSKAKEHLGRQEERIIMKDKLMSVIINHQWQHTSILLLEISRWLIRDKLTDGLGISDIDRQLKFTHSIFSSSSTFPLLGFPIPSDVSCTHTCNQSNNTLNQTS